MYFLCSTRLTSWLGLLMASWTVALNAGAQDVSREGLTCGQGRSIGLDFCYDANLVEPGLPLGDFAYVLVSEDRQVFITVSLVAPDQGLPGLDPNTLKTQDLDPQNLPMGPSYAVKTKINLIDPDAATPESYNASLRTEGSDFGFHIAATRLGSVPGGTVRLTLMTMGQVGDMDALTQAFTHVSETMILNP